MSVPELIFALAGMAVAGAVAIVALATRQPTAFYWSLATFAAVAGVPVTQLATRLFDRGQGAARVAQVLPVAVSLAALARALGFASGGLAGLL
jgi:hypothetical protein